MTAKERIIEAGKAAPKRIIDIECLDGLTLSFELPHGGIERTMYRHAQEEFVKMHENKVNPAWAQWMPECGYNKGELTLIHILHYMCTEKWTQQDVIEMMVDNDVELFAIAKKLSEAIVEAFGKDSKADIESKKPSTPVAALATGGQEQP